MRKEPKKEPNEDAREEAKKGALLRHIAGSLEVGAVHRRGLVGTVLLLSSMLLACMVLSAVVSVLSSTVAWYSGSCSCFSAVISVSSSEIACSFGASCGVGRVDCSHCSGGNGFLNSLSISRISAKKEAFCSAIRY